LPAYGVFKLRQLKTFLCAYDGRCIVAV